jgi:DNA-binding transcriptional regulator YhcF (GntR family)
MNPDRSYPAIQKAINFVKDNLEKETWRPGECLPSTRKLAVIAGVSAATMIRAVAELKSENLINGVERGRIRAGSELPGHIPSAEPQNSVWRMKRAAVEQDILSGVYAHEKWLPSFKELQVRYGACFRTMRKILRSMMDDNVVQLRGKRYEFQNLSARSSLRRIVFITYRISPMPSSALNQGQYRILGMFEQECLRRGIKLEVLEIDFYNAVETRQAALRPEISAPGLGYIMDLLWTRGDEFQRSHIDFLARLAGMQRPVALLDETGDFALPLPFNENPLFQVFRIEGKRAGGRVARLLLGMGHRSVAYISTSHNALYSRLRLEGVVEQYSKAGCTAGVRPVINERMDHVLLYILTVTGFDDALIRRILSVDRTERQAEDLFNEFIRFRAGGPTQMLTRDDARIIRKNLAGIGDLEIGRAHV